MESEREGGREGERGTEELQPVATTNKKIQPCQSLDDLGGGGGVGGGHLGTVIMLAMQSHSLETFT